MSGVVITYAGGSIEFDATLSENHPSSNVVTEHPVERGVNVTDHVRPEVDRVTLEVYVTNAPIKVPRTNLDGATGGTSALELEVPTTGELPIAIPGIGAALKGAGAFNRTISVKAQTLQFDEFDRVASVYHSLKFLQETAQLLTISTSLVEYENFVIQSVTAPRQAGDGDAMKIQIEARQLRFVTTKTVPAPKTPVGAKKANLGAKSTTDAGSAKKSLALKAAQALGLAQ